MTIAELVETLAGLSCEHCESGLPHVRNQLFHDEGGAIAPCNAAEIWRWFDEQSATSKASNIDLHQE